MQSMNVPTISMEWQQLKEDHQCFSVNAYKLIQLLTSSDEGQTYHLLSFYSKFLHSVAFV